MEQRVNIQYSIDIDELPVEVARLMQKGVDALKDVCVNDLESLSSFNEENLLSIHSLEAVERTRKKLAAIDYVLNDVTNIVDGFIKFKTSPSKSDTPDEKIPEMPPEFRNPDILPDDAALSELKSRIENFKRAPTTQ